ncbi:hypothetical protein [Andreprevotia chitinilytica]|uniref:hypothetical protein n=1 Tax=Andreprevotia chitinilytica TaxID=396808 RepID=UPI00055220DD|nr:hypothetical protein [Andreprevotia chitinilytica]
MAQLMHYLETWLEWPLRRALERAGVLTIGGVIALAIALGFTVSAYQLHREQVALLKTIPKRQRATVPEPEVPQDALTARSLTAFYGGLPTQRGLPALVGALLQQAESEGLTPASGQYNVQRDPRAKVLRYRIQLPLKGDYQKVQGFLLKSLRAQPALALETVAFSRKKIDAREVEAKISFVVFLRDQDPTHEAAPDAAHEAAGAL